MIQSNDLPLSEILDSTLIADTFEEAPELIEMRLSDIAIKIVGSRSGVYRWIVEPDIGSDKCTMGLEHLRARSSETLEREMWTAMLTYNLVRLKMLQSGYAGERDIRSLSFTETYQLLSTNWLLCACVGVNEALSRSAQKLRQNKISRIALATVGRNRG